MDLVQTAADRKTVCINATAHQAEQSFIDEQEASRQLAIQHNFEQRICRWCNATGLGTTIATEETFSLPVGNIIASDVLDQWETTLQGRGYVISRLDGIFTIELQ